MRITLTRRGGFAGVTIHREIDTATLAPKVREDVERLAARARAAPAEPPRTPDAFEYEIAFDGARAIVGDDDAAWRALIERLFATSELQ